MEEKQMSLHRMNNTMYSLMEVSRALIQYKEIILPV